MDDTTQNTTPGTEEHILPKQDATDVNSDSNEQMDFSEEEAQIAANAEEFHLEDGLDEESESQASVSYANLGVSELLAAFNQLLEEKPVETIRKDVELIKSSFYKLYKQEAERLRKSFIDAGGNPEEYAPEENSAESEFKQLFGRYKSMRNAHIQKQESEKEENYQQKLKIIDELKALIDKKEDLNQTFTEFRELQRRWKEIGQVPQAHIRDTWDTYNHYVEIFYSFIKINRELRDLDLKKNLEAKAALCEKVEELDKEEQVIPAFRMLQKYHELWREIGPVPVEFKDSLWERFKEATSKINKKHQAYFESQKEEQQKNYEAKQALCERIEAINAASINGSKEWSNYSKEVVELQKKWKEIGPVSRKDNGKLYERFRKACDVFFASKRDIFNNIKKELKENLQKKIDLCVRAEELAESSDWKKTTDMLIAIQKQWKEVGVVPRKVSDEIWQRFRKACDHFFERKNEHYASQEEGYADNLRLKEELIEEIKNFTPTDNIQGDVVTLKEFQQRWNQIGFVPIKEKERVQKEYRKAIDSRFKSLRLSDTERKLTRFKSKIENTQSDSKGGNRVLRSEREKLFSQIRQLESDITLWENNIGFFAKSKNADALIAEVRKKIERTKQEIILLEEKIKVIDKQFE